MNTIIPDSNDHPGDCNNASGVVAGGVVARAAGVAAGVVPEAAFAGGGEISSVVGGVATSLSANGTAAVATGDASGRDDVADIPGFHGVTVTGAGNNAAATGFYLGGVDIAVPSAAANAAATGFYPGCVDNAVPSAAAPRGVHNMDFLLVEEVVPILVFLLEVVCLPGRAIDLSTEKVFPNQAAVPVLPPVIVPVPPAASCGLFQANSFFPDCPVAPVPPAAVPPDSWVSAAGRGFLLQFLLMPGFLLLVEEFLLVLLPMLLKLPWFHLCLLPLFLLLLPCMQMEWLLLHKLLIMEILQKGIAFINSIF